MRPQHLNKHSWEKSNMLCKENFKDINIFMLYHTHTHIFFLTKLILTGWSHLTQSPFKLVNGNFPSLLQVQSCEPSSQAFLSRSKIISQNLSMSNPNDDPSIPLFFSGLSKLSCHVCHIFLMVDVTITSPARYSTLFKKR